MELPRLTVLNERFAIRSVLGKLGPFEATYLAWDLENEEQVVVREYLPLDLAKRDERGIGIVPKSPEVSELFEYGLKRFAKEAELVSRIDHPNVVREREYFQENGTIYRVFDYHAGASLSYVLEPQGGKVSPKTAVTILMPLMDGIRAGHAQGLVHGAISPDKIFLTKSGRPMLLSFKTTHLLLAQRTRNLDAFQQPGYSPPEQYTPRGKHGPWSDVYGCGATLYKMLSGNTLPGIPERLSEDKVPAMIDQTFDLSIGTRNALKSALDMNISRRPQTIDGLRAMLIEGFELANSHVPPPDDPQPKEAYSPRQPVPEPAAFTAEEPAFETQDEPAMKHFSGQRSIKPLSFPTNRGALDERDSLTVNRVHFGDGPSGRNGITESIDQPLRSDSFASAFENSAPNYNSIAVAKSDPIVRSSAMPERTTAILEEDNAWDDQRLYRSRRNHDVKRGNGRTIILFVGIGAILTALALYAVTRLQNRDANSYQIGNSGYATAFMKGDSLYMLARDVIQTDNGEDARSLFIRARENYSVALTLGTGDQTTLRQRIDSVDSYLNVPVEIEINEKEALAFISRGDSVVRAADQLTLAGDSAKARLLYMQARESYMKVLDVMPEDSLALTRLRQATQRMAEPVRIVQPANTQPVEITEAERLQQLYLRFKIKGDSAFDARDFTSARASFSEALLYKPEDPHATRRVQQIDRLAEQNEQLGKYRQYMKAGLRLKESGRLDDAKTQFEFALEARPDDEEAISSIAEINSILEAERQKEADYLENIARGDVLFERNDYEAALVSYQAALIAKPDDEHASRRITQIREQLNALATQEKELPEGMVDDNGIYNFTEEPPVLVGGREVLQSRLRYPPKAQEAGIEGRVSVRMIVDETGRMLNPTILKGIRHDMDAEVMRVIRGARFEPGRVGGQPVKSWYTLFFEFKLDNE